MPVHDRSSFENLYAGQPRWETGRPQQALLDLADRITGSVLDAGCGTGENALFFAGRGQRVTGIDFLAEPIHLARQKAAGRGLTATFLVMDALALKELPEVFDSAIDSGLFHVFGDEDRRRYVEGLASVLRPGGRLFLLCFSDAEPGERGKPRPEALPDRALREQRLRVPDDARARDRRRDDADLLVEVRDRGELGQGDRADLGRRRGELAEGGGELPGELDQHGRCLRHRHGIGLHGQQRDLGPVHGEPRRVGGPGGDPAVPVLVGHDAELGRLVDRRHPDHGDGGAG